MINDYITQGDPFIENFSWKTRDKPGLGWKGFWVNYGMNKIRSEDFWNLVSNLECTEVVIPKDTKSTILNEKWSSFFDFAFANNEFSRLFRRSNTLNRSYYDLFFDSKEVHLVARNTIKQKSLEIYIEDNIELYDFIVKHLNLLSEEIDDNIDLYYEAVSKNLKHRKLIIYYEEDLEQNFNEWIVNNSLKFVKIIRKLEKNFLNRLDFQILIEDDAINQSIANLKKFPDSFEYTEELSKAPEKIIKQGILTYKRDRQKTINALVHANYQCEMEGNHPTFIRKKSNHPYTEAHHLIPLKYQMEFEYSLDVEENIVSLCSNCHNEIHYGENASIIIEKLYNDRKELLKRKNIGISLEKLLSFYGY